MSDTIITTTPKLDAIEAGPRTWPSKSRLRCADGTLLSVITGAMLCCTPRDDTGPYEKVEVGTWVPTPDSWAEYADYSHSNDESGDHLRVHGYVPVTVVREFIAAHGGEA